MKRLSIFILVAIAVASCTENSRVKHWGGEGTINLPANRKLINITWKENQIWYLTRPMVSTDTAETYQFSEESSWGAIEGTYNIIETRK